MILISITKRRIYRQGFMCLKLLFCIFIRKCLSVLWSTPQMSIYVHKVHIVLVKLASTFEGSSTLCFEGLGPISAPCLEVLLWH